MHTERAQTDLAETLLQVPEVCDEVQLLRFGVGQHHQAVEQLVHLLVQSRHRLHRRPLVHRHADAALLPAQPRQRGAALLLELHQSAVCEDAAHHCPVAGQQQLGILAKTERFELVSEPLCENRAKPQIVQVNKNTQSGF